MKIIGFKTNSNCINYGSFDIKCKKFNAKKTRNLFLGHLGESSSYFSNPALDHGGSSGGCKKL